jgi:hypothetical protein
MDEIIITIHHSDSNGGWDYSIYGGYDAYEEQDSLDGGICTSPTLLAALDMAFADAKAVVRRKG